MSSIQILEAGIQRGKDTIKKSVTIAIKGIKFQYI
jgi:hypothetical protein